MKRIEINPELFNMKTKKRREPLKRPIISPNVLKNKLLSRIKAHKKHEIANPSSDSSTPKLVDTNEFDDSLDFFKLLARKSEINKKTLKNQSLLDNTPYVNLDLPPDLTQPVYETPSIKLNAITTPPYSNLKNGSRPTYREWNKTQRNVNALQIPIPSVNTSISLRENRLNELKERIRQKHQNISASISPKEQIATEVYNLITQPVTNPIDIIESRVIETINPDIKSDVTSVYNNVVGKNDGRVISQTIKKTIKRKYTLGKSANNRTISILLKDVNSRKNVLKAQRDLKKKSIGDVKQYLREHNLIHVGSNAPSDVLRKLYESAMMSGEITNNNKDTLLNNLLKEQNIV
jgi:hypothetical protein